MLDSTKKCIAHELRLYTRQAFLSVWAFGQVRAACHLLGFESVNAALEANAVDDALSEAIEALEAKDIGPAVCTDHGPEFVCEDEGYSTDGRGFVHKTHLAGRVPLRRCARCGELKSLGEWAENYFSTCKPCQKLEDKRAKKGGGLRG